MNDPSYSEMRLWTDIAYLAVLDDMKWDPYMADLWYNTRRQILEGTV
jgi:hypothetical protein